MRVSRGRRWGLTGREPALSRPSAPARVPSAGSAAAAAPPPLASRVGPSARACPPAAAGGNPRCLQAWQRRRAPGTGPGLCRRSPGVVPSLGAPRSAGWYCGAGLWRCRTRAACGPQRAGPPFANPRRSPWGPRASQKPQMPREGTRPRGWSAGSIAGE